MEKPFEETQTHTIESQVHQFNFYRIHTINNGMDGLMMANDRIKILDFLLLTFSVW